MRTDQFSKNFPLAFDQVEPGHFDFGQFDCGQFDRDQCGPDQADVHLTCLRWDARCFDVWTGWQSWRVF